MIGTGFIESVDSHILVAEAKSEWPRSAVPQIVAQAGCLLKRRLETGRETPVFAVLSNGHFFRFFAIHTDAVVYSSTDFVLQRGEDNSYQSSTFLHEILRWMHWMISTYESVSPRASSDSSPQDIDRALAEIRSCFKDRSTRAA